MASKTMKMVAMGALLLGALLSQGCVPFGCGVSDENEASLYVVDAETGEPVSKPTFSSNGAPMTGSCQDPTATGACGSYLFFISSSYATIDIAAPGYVPATVEIDASESASVHLAVELRRIK